MLRSAVVVPLLFATGLLAQTVETIPLRAILLGGNETQQPAVTAAGGATVWLHVVRDASGKIVSGSVDTGVGYNLGSNQTLTGFNISSGAAGADGTVAVPFTFTQMDANGRGALPAAQTAFPSTDVSLDTINAILADPSQFYVNVLSSAYPGGVMRGQLARATTVVRMGLMIPENEVPPIASKPWSATGAVMLLLTRDAQNVPNSAYVIFDVAYRGFPDDQSFTGLHVHLGAAGVNGPVTIDSGLKGPVPVAAGGSGVLHYESEVDLTRANAIDTINAFVNNPMGAYINVHTTAYPGGAARSQLMFTDKTEFQVNMATANEVPPVTGVTAQTPGKITVYTIRGATGAATAGAVLFDVNPSFPANTTFTGLHIHNGLAGANGPVRIDSRLGSFPILVGAGGSGNITRLVTVGSGDALATLNTLLMNPQNTYVNIHTSVNPGGATRVQLGTAADVPSITTVQTNAPGAAFVKLAPGSQFVITGTGLTNVPGDLTGFNNLQTAPTSLNGVSVTFAGVQAPLSSISGTQIFGQVPFEVAPGQVAVAVTTPNGVSQTFPVTLLSAAPAIATGPNGVFATHADGTAVTPSSPATAGEVIYVNAVGLGQTNPPLTTGAVVPTNVTFTAGQLDARIGGYNTSVVSAVATPGSIGSYRVGIIVPAGLQPGQGNAPMLLQMGLITSNVVALPVR